MNNESEDDSSIYIYIVGEFKRFRNNAAAGWILNEPRLTRDPFKPRISKRDARNRTPLQPSLRNSSSFIRETGKIQDSQDIEQPIPDENSKIPKKISSRVSSKILFACLLKINSNDRKKSKKREKERREKKQDLYKRSETRNGRF